MTSWGFFNNFLKVANPHLHQLFNVYGFIISVTESYKAICTITKYVESSWDIVYQMQN